MRMPTRFISHTKGSSSTKLDGEKGTGSILESIFDASFVKRILSSNRSSEMSGETTATSMSLQLPYVPFAYEPKRYADWMRIPRVFNCRRNSLVLSITLTLISTTRRLHLFWLVLSFRKDARLLFWPLLPLPAKISLFYRVPYFTRISES